jgi:hypothetical protein
MLPVYLVFSLFGMQGKGTAAACALCTVIIAIRLHLEFINRFWFWGVIASVAILNVLLVIYTPLPNKNYTFAIVAPFGYAEYLLIALCIRLAQRHVAKN